MMFAASWGAPVPLSRQLSQPECRADPLGHSLVLPGYSSGGHSHNEAGAGVEAVAVEGGGGGGGDNDGSEEEDGLDCRYTLDTGFECDMDKAFN